MYNMRLIIIKVNGESAGQKKWINIKIYALDNLKLTDYNFKL